MGARKWFPLALLSIALPIGLLAAFRLTGVLPEPLAPETVTAEAVIGEIERPDTNIDIGKNVENYYGNNEISITYAILINDYVKTGIFFDADELHLRVNVTASVVEGFVSDVYLEFREDYEVSGVDFSDDREDSRRILEMAEFDNLSLVDFDDIFGEKLRGNVKAFVEAEGINNPEDVHFSVFPCWILAGPQDQSHQLEIVLETTFFNGTFYKKVVLPIVLKVLPDAAGNSLDNAAVVGFGKCNAYVSYLGDPDDFYKVWINEGETVKINLSHTYWGFVNPIYDLYLYNPRGKLVVSLTQREIPKIILYTTNQTGYWYIRVNVYVSHGYYSLLIEKGE